MTARQIGKLQKPAGTPNSLFACCCGGKEDAATSDDDHPLEQELAINKAEQPYKATIEVNRPAQNAVEVPLKIEEDEPLFSPKAQSSPAKSSSQVSKGEPGSSVSLRRKAKAAPLDVASIALTTRFVEPNQLVVDVHSVSLLDESIDGSLRLYFAIHRGSRKERCSMSIAVECKPRTKIVIVQEKVRCDVSTLLEENNTDLDLKSRHVLLQLKLKRRDSDKVVAVGSHQVSCDDTAQQAVVVLSPSNNRISRREERHNTKSEASSIKLETPHRAFSVPAVNATAEHSRPQNGELEKNAEALPVVTVSSTLSLRPVRVPADEEDAVPFMDDAQLDTSNLRTATLVADQHSSSSSSVLHDMRRSFNGPLFSSASRNKAPESSGAATSGQRAEKPDTTANTRAEDARHDESSASLVGEPVSDSDASIRIRTIVGAELEIVEMDSSLLSSQTIRLANANTPDASAVTGSDDTLKATEQGRATRSADDTPVEATICEMASSFQLVDVNASILDADADAERDISLQTVDDGRHPTTIPSLNHNRILDSRSVSPHALDAATRPESEGALAKIAQDPEICKVSISDDADAASDGGCTANHGDPNAVNGTESSAISRLAASQVETIAASHALLAEASSDDTFVQCVEAIDEKSESIAANSDGLASNAYVALTHSESFPPFPLEQSSNVDYFSANLDGLLTSMVLDADLHEEPVNSRDAQLVDAKAIDNLAAQQINGAAANLPACITASDTQNLQEHVSSSSNLEITTQEADCFDIPLTLAVNQSSAGFEKVLNATLDDHVIAPQPTCNGVAHEVVHAEPNEFDTHADYTEICSIVPEVNESAIAGLIETDACKRPEEVEVLESLQTDEYQSIQSPRPSGSSDHVSSQPTNETIETAVHVVEAENGFATLPTAASQFTMRLPSDADYSNDQLGSAVMPYEQEVAHVSLEQKSQSSPSPACLESFPISAVESSSTTIPGDFTKTLDASLCDPNPLDDSKLRLQLAAVAGANAVVAENAEANADRDVKAEDIEVCVDQDTVVEDAEAGVNQDAEAEDIEVRVDQDTEAGTDRDVEAEDAEAGVNQDAEAEDIEVRVDQDTVAGDTEAGVNQDAEAEDIEVRVDQDTVAEDTEAGVNQDAEAEDIEVRVDQDTEAGTDRDVEAEDAEAGVNQDAEAEDIEVRVDQDTVAEDTEAGVNQDAEAEDTEAGADRDVEAEDADVDVIIPQIASDSEKLEAELIIGIETVLEQHAPEVISEEEVVPRLEAEVDISSSDRSKEHVQPIIPEAAASATLESDHQRLRNDDFQELADSFSADVTKPSQFSVSQETGDRGCGANPQVEVLNFTSCSDRPSADVLRNLEHSDDINPDYERAVSTAADSNSRQQRDQLLQATIDEFPNSAETFLIDPIVQDCLVHTVVASSADEKPVHNTVEIAFCPCTSALSASQADAISTSSSFCSMLENPAGTGENSDLKRQITVDSGIAIMAEAPAQTIDITCLDQDAIAEIAEVDVDRDATAEKTEPDANYQEACIQLACGTSPSTASVANGSEKRLEGTDVETLHQEVRENVEKSDGSDSERPIELANPSVTAECTENADVVEAIVQRKREKTRQSHAKIDNRVNSEPTPSLEDAELIGNNNLSTDLQLHDAFSSRFQLAIEGSCSEIRPDSPGMENKKQLGDVACMNLQSHSQSNDCQLPIVSENLVQLDLNCEEHRESIISDFDNEALSQCPNSGHEQDNELSLVMAQHDSEDVNITPDYELEQSAQKAFTADLQMETVAEPPSGKLEQALAEQRNPPVVGAALMSLAPNDSQQRDGALVCEILPSEVQIADAFDTSCERSRTPQLCSPTFHSQSSIGNAAAPNADSLQASIVDNARTSSGSDSESESVEQSDMLLPLSNSSSLPYRGSDTTVTMLTAELLASSTSEAELHNTQLESSGDHECAHRPVEQFMLITTSATASSHAQTLVIGSEFEPSDEFHNQYLAESTPRTSRCSSVKHGLRTVTTVPTFAADDLFTKIQPAAARTRRRTNFRRRAVSCPSFSSSAERSTNQNSQIRGSLTPDNRSVCSPRSAQPYRLRLTLQQWRVSASLTETLQNALAKRPKSLQTDRIGYQLADNSTAQSTDDESESLLALSLSFGHRRRVPQICVSSADQATFRLHQRNLSSGNVSGIDFDDNMEVFTSASPTGWHRETLRPFAFSDVYDVVSVPVPLFEAFPSEATSASERIREISRKLKEATVLSKHSRELHSESDTNTVDFPATSWIADIETRLMSFIRQINDSQRGRDSVDSELVRLEREVNEVLVKLRNQCSKLMESTSRRVPLRKSVVSPSSRMMRKLNALTEHEATGLNSLATPHRTGIVVQRQSTASLSKPYASLSLTMPGSRSILARSMRNLFSVERFYGYHGVHFTKSTGSHQRQGATNFSAPSNDDK